ncbi:MAG: hypothetical protein HOP09_08065 [Hyphomicrobium sp.]|nr:hypothetical protein [Hyphomicrobium sp.]
MPKNTKSLPARRQPATKVNKNLQSLKTRVRQMITKGDPLSESGRDPEQEAREVQLRISQLENEAAETSAKGAAGSRDHKQDSLEARVKSLSRSLKPNGKKKNVKTR